MSDTSGPVRLERRGAVQWIVIDREERRNAINEAVIAEIAAGVRAAADDRAVRAVVLTGAGERAFSAGADLKPGTSGAAFEFDFSEPRHYLVELFRDIERCDVPILARVNGHVRAGGMGLLCACDLAIAADTATFGTPEAGLGLFPMMILPHMIRVLPRRKLLEMCVTGEAFSAAEALAMGLVNYVVPAAELDHKVEWLLGRIVDKSPTAVRLGKYAFHAMQDMSVGEGLTFAEANIRLVSQTEDAREGISAFAEKRPPRWRQR
jgi:enoyl-CoA hydratase/carnithine racemase